MKTEKGQIVTLLDVEVEAYRRMLDSRTIRKNLTIPSWLNAFAESKHVNFSKVLQDSLMELYQKESAG
jgi:hypothetical protein